MVGIPNVRYLHQVEYLEGDFQTECVFQKPQGENSGLPIYTYYFTLNSLTVLLLWSGKVK